MSKSRRQLNVSMSFTANGRIYTHLNSLNIFPWSDNYPWRRFVEGSFAKPVGYLRPNVNGDCDVLHQLTKYRSHCQELADVPSNS